MYCKLHHHTLPNNVYSTSCCSSDISIVPIKIIQYVFGTSLYDLYAQQTEQWKWQRVQRAEKNGNYPDE
jgi:hypothetical protein